MGRFCSTRGFAKLTAVIGLILIVGAVYVSISFDFDLNEQILGLVLTGGLAGLLFLVASDLMRKVIKLQSRIVKLEEQVARLTQPKF